MIARAFRLLRIGACCLALGPVAALQAKEGLSTTFVKVRLKDVPLGKTIAVAAQTGPGITVTNLGDEKLSLVVDLLPPQPGQLDRTYEPIPDVNWLAIAPRSFELEPHETYTLDAELTVPDKRAYRGKRYQVMIWIHGDPEEGEGLTIGGGLLTRLRFRTAAR